MKNLIIPIPEGHEIDMFKSSLETGIVIFKIKDIELPTTNEECIPFLPKDCYFIDSIGDINTTEGRGRENSNIIATKEYAEAFLALIQLVKFRDIWNEGWVADWNIDRIKHVIYFRFSKKLHDDLYMIPSVLSFKSEEIRDKFSETFDELIQIAKPLL